MGKYWFHFRTIGDRIGTTITDWRTRMEEELKTAGKVISDPASISMITYAWVILLAVWGGLIRVMREIKFGEKSAAEMTWIFFVEILTSAFVGVLTFYLCTASDIQPLYTAVLTSTSGWMGVRALAVFEAIYNSRKGD